jgi:8-oxo-dGTP diphosphatase
VQRAVFYEEDDARTVASRLRADGFDVEVRREPFSGEDDDEDHPWAVRTDAPEVMLELLAEEHDGWLDHDVAPPVPLPPLELPTAPRRLLRHGP